MERFRAMASFAIALLLTIYCGGCLPSESHIDEEKDPHFQRGRYLVESQDFKGAIEEFEKALETNPRNSAAHFELGWIYENKMSDYAAAIYHYERYLQLRPDSDHSNSIDVKDRIRGCKQQLANTEFPLPNNQNLQREVDRLTAENLLLRQQVEALRNQLAGTPNPSPNPGMVAAPNSAPAPAPPAAAPPSRVALPPAREQPRTQYVAAPRHDPVTPPANVSTSSNSGPHRVHVVRQHETIRSIAAEYGVKVNAILAINPGVEPRRLRVGQSLNVP